MNARFVRLAEKDRASVPFIVDGRPAEALEGDSLLVALLNMTDRVSTSAFGDGAQAGFCLMGACQGCWVWTEPGERLRACTARVIAGMRIQTSPPSWP